MKKITIPPETGSVSVAKVFRLMLEQAKGGRIRIVKDRDGKTISHTQGGLVAIGELQRHFLAFCSLKNVIPKRRDAPWTFDYEPTEEKNLIYEISVDDFNMFASGYGIEVSFNEADSSNELESESTVELDESDEGEWDVAPIPFVQGKINRPRLAQTPRRVASEIPGNYVPRIAVGRLALKAAWEIEIETKRIASRDEVIERLQEWADSGKEPAVLRKSIKKMRAVEWVTVGGKPKPYGVDAVEKALAKWKQSRK